MKNNANISRSAGYRCKSLTTSSCSSCSSTTSACPFLSKRSKHTAPCSSSSTHVRSWHSRKPPKPCRLGRSVRIAPLLCVLRIEAHPFDPDNTYQAPQRARLAVRRLRSKSTRLLHHSHDETTALPFLPNTTFPAFTFIDSQLPPAKRRLPLRPNEFAFFFNETAIDFHPTALPPFLRLCFFLLACGIPTCFCWFWGAGLALRWVSFMPMRHSSVERVS